MHVSIVQGQYLPKWQDKGHEGYPIAFVVNGQANASVGAVLNEFHGHRIPDGVMRVTSVSEREFGPADFGQIPTRFTAGNSAGGAFGSGVDFTRTRDVATSELSLEILNARTEGECSLHVPPELALTVLNWIRETAPEFKVDLANRLGIGYEYYSPDRPVGETKRRWHIPYN